MSYTDFCTQLETNIINFSFILVDDEVKEWNSIILSNMGDKIIDCIQRFIDKYAPRRRSGEPRINIAVDYLYVFDIDDEDANDDVADQYTEILKELTNQVIEERTYTSFWKELKYLIDIFLITADERTWKRWNKHVLDDININDNIIFEFINAWAPERTSADKDVDLVAFHLMREEDAN